MSVGKELTKGLYAENPVFKQALGLCPTLAVSNSVRNAVGMGLAMTFVLVMSNIIISLIRRFVPRKIRIPIYIVVIATFVTIVDLVMAGFAPDLHKALGIFVPLIVVNCIILGRAEAFAGRNTVFRSLLDGLGMGFGFSLALLTLSLIRELLGDGRLYGFPVLGPGFQPMLIMILPPGAFLTIGLLMGLMNWLDRRRCS
ncbi:MAG: electron transport complex subunit E [candidate division KSB1 bacterium]|nr:electron transport complex subunit E [candidate division KSB1 bacterium]